MADAFRILEDLLRVAGIRHGLIVSNISNVDTPGYNAKDVDFQNILNNEVLSLRTTSGAHIGSGDSGLKVNIIEDEGEPWKDKNNVELDREVARLTENALFFEAGLTMLSTKIRMFKNALRRQL